MINSPTDYRADLTKKASTRMLESMIQEAQEDPGAEVDIPFLDDSVDDFQLPEDEDDHGQMELIKDVSLRPFNFQNISMGMSQTAGR